MKIWVRAILPMVALFMFVPKARADAPASDPRQVAHVVANLSAERWSARRDAVEWLITAGPGADLPLRRFLDRTSDPEARMWAQRVLNRTGQIRRVKPALVTLSLDHADVRTAFQRVADIEGAEIPTNPPDLLASCPGAITAEFHGLTYWQAILELCRRSDLEVRCGPRGTVLIRRQPAAAPRDAIGCSGAFLVCGRLARWSQDAADPGRSLRLEIHAEPRAQLLRGDWHVELAEASDPRGQSLRPLAESGMNMGGSGTLADGYSWFVPLRPVASAETRLARLRGSVNVLLAEQVITGQAPDHAGDHTLGGPMPIHMPCGSVSASVLRVVKDGAVWTMEMQVDIDPAEVEWDVLMQSLASGGLRAFDADGREFVLRNFWRAGEGPSSQIKCKWGPNPNPSTAQPGEPYKLVWRVPGKMVRVKVPFELTDVRLVER